MDKKRERMENKKKKQQLKKAAEEEKKAAKLMVYDHRKRREREYRSDEGSLSDTSYRRHAAYIQRKAAVGETIASTAEDPLNLDLNSNELIYFRFQ